MNLKSILEKYEKKLNSINPIGMGLYIRILSCISLTRELDKRFYSKEKKGGINRFQEGIARALGALMEIPTGSGTFCLGCDKVAPCSHKLQSLDVLISIVDVFLGLL